MDNFHKQNLEQMNGRYKNTELPNYSCSLNQEQCTKVNSIINNLILLDLKL